MNSNGTPTESRSRSKDDYRTKLVRHRHEQTFESVAKGMQAMASVMGDGVVFRGNSKNGAKIEPELSMQMWILGWVIVGLGPFIVVLLIAMSLAGTYERTTMDSHQIQREQMKAVPAKQQ